jgi:hypothetical protein
MIGSFICYSLLYDAVSNTENISVKQGMAGGDVKGDGRGLM